MIRNITYMVAILLMLALAPLRMKAQNATYNLQKAVEAINNNNLDKATSWVDKELKINPKNGYAWILKASLVADGGDIANGLKALDNAMKYIPKQDEVSLGKAYILKSKIYESADDKEQALAALNEGLKRYPKNVSLLNVRAEKYYNDEKYDEAIDDYKALLETDPGNLDMMDNIAGCLISQKKYDDALIWLNKVLQADNENTSALKQRSLVRFAQDKYKEAIDDMLSLYNIDADDEVSYIFKVYVDTTATRDYVISGLKERMNKDTKNWMWPSLLGDAYYQLQQYPQAGEAMKKAFNLNKSAEGAYQVFKTYFMTNDYANAETWIRKALQLAKDSDESTASYEACIGDLYCDQGLYDKALAQYDKAIDSGANYYGVRGKTYMLKGDYKKALDDYNKAIGDDPDEYDARDLLYRGWLEKEQGMDMQAEGDFRKAIEMDSVGTPTAPTFISQHYLGIDKAALESVAKCLADNPSSSDYVGAAELYALLGDKEMAMRKLEIALEKGFNSYCLLRDIPFLKPLKGYQPYENMLKKYIKQ